jgi:pimeloyl-ACP methyl ester carboxylesterase
MTASIRRGFVAVGSRRVHYRWAGDGPPVVMLHGSPADSQMMLHELGAAARRYTVFALDTPGFGLSDPLPGEFLEVTDLAAATAEAMAALRLPPCRVYGTHTGAAIGIELGVGWPEMVTGLVLEGVPIFTADEIEIVFKGALVPMTPDPLGGHLTSTWMRFRDQFTWFPWSSRDVNRLNPVDRPTQEDIHHWVSMFYRSCRTYIPAYGSVARYLESARRAAAALDVPTVFTAAATDMLHPHLDRLPPLKPGQRIATLPEPLPERCATLLEFLDSLPGTSRPPSPVWPGPVGSDPALGIARADGGDVFVRCYGERGRPALLLAHDAPGTGLGCQELARTLSDSFFVIVPDLPGCGESSSPDEATPILAAAAAALVAVADQFGLERYAVAGLGCGAAVAASLLAHQDPRLSAIILHEPPVPDDATADAIAPAITLSPEGAHWVRAWLMLRDAQIYRPWFAGTVESQRRTQGNFEAQWLHDQTAALMTGHATYHRLPRAAWRFDSLAAVRGAPVPVFVLTDGDSAAQIRSNLLHKGTA